MYSDQRKISNMVEVFTFNRHPAYIHLLSYTDAEINVYGGWDKNVRPDRPCINPITNTSELRRGLEDSEVWLSHLIYPDLLFFMRQRQFLGGDKKVIQIMHGRKDRTGHIRSHLLRHLYKAGKMRADSILDVVTSWRALEFVFISDQVANSWNLEGPTIRPGAINLIEEESIPNPSKRGEYVLVVGNRMDRDHFSTEILEELNVEHEVVFCGTDNDEVPFETDYVPWGDLQRHYRNCLCYLNLLTPPENPFNLATIEAMSAGAPVLTLPHPDSIYTDGTDTIICSNVDEFKSAVERLKTDPELRARLSEQGRKFTEEYFSMKRFKDEWNSIFEDE